MPAFRTENRRQINRMTPVANVTEACTPSCIHVRLYVYRITLYTWILLSKHTVSIAHSDTCSQNTNNLVVFLNRTDVHQPAHQRSQLSVVSVWSLLSISQFSLNKLSR